jgi:hypothetical protein
MNIKSLVNNKFIIAIPIALLLFGCLYKFNEFKNIKDENSDKKGENDDIENPDIKYYIKALLISYLLGVVFVILIKKGYNYYINGTKSNSSNIDVNDNVNDNDNEDNILKKDKKSDLFNNENAIINRENELNNDIKDLNVDIDTSNLESIEIPTLHLPKPKSPEPEKRKDNIVSSLKNDSLETKKQALLEKRQKLLALKNQPKKPKKIEQFQTGAPNF